MSDKRTTPDLAEGARRRKRAAPTIDLTATDVSAAPTHESTDAAGDTSSDAPARQPERPEPDHAGDGGNERRNWRDIRSMALAGIGGAAAVAIALFGLWSAGVVPARFAAPVTTPDSAMIAALSERMARLEGAPARPLPSDPSLGERLSAADNAMKSLGIALAALNKRNDEIAARAEAVEKAVAELRDTVHGLARNAAERGPGDVDALHKRLASLEQAVKGAAGDKVARLALTAVALRDAVIRGASFAVELEEARTLGAGEKSLAPLVSFAATGVPTPAALAQDLRALIPAMVKASGAQAPTGNFMDRLQANAAKLVRIRPVDAPAGDDPSTVLARIEVEVMRADIDAALADLEKLDAATRAPAREWIASARGRQAAIAAARQLTVDTMRMLGNR